VRFPDRLLDRVRDRSRGALLAAALTLAAAAPLSAARAQLPLTTGSWQPFAWYDGAGPVGDPFGGYTFTITGPGTLRVVDTDVIGDVFQLFLNGTLRLTTSAPPSDYVGMGLGTYDGDIEWTYRDYWSFGELALDPGTYQLDLVVQETAPGWDYGQAWIRLDAEEAPPTSTVPEPASVTLLATGLLAAALVGRRRTRAAQRAAQEA
jgi:hypothetical protein